LFKQPGHGQKYGEHSPLYRGILAVEWGNGTTTRDKDTSRETRGRGSPRKANKQKNIPQTHDITYFQNSRGTKGGMK